MKTNVIIIIVSVLLISIGIALFFILSSKSSGGSSGVNANDIKKRAQFTQINEQFKLKEKYFNSTTPTSTTTPTTTSTTTPTTTSTTTTPTSTTTPTISQEHINEVNTIYNRLLDTLVVYNLAGTLTDEDVTNITKEYTAYKNIAAGDDAGPDFEEESFLRVFYKLINTKDDDNKQVEKQNTAIGLMGDMLHFLTGAMTGVFIMFFNSNENNKYKIRLPKNICEVSLFSNIINSKGIFKNINNKAIFEDNNNDFTTEFENIQDINEISSIIHWLYHSKFISLPSDDIFGNCKTNYFNLQQESTSQTTFDTLRIRKVGDSCELLRQNIWANTLGDWLNRSGGLGQEKDCNNFDPTNFVNNTDTGDWEFEVTRQQLINMFKRLYMNDDESDTDNGRTTYTSPSN